MSKILIDTSVWISYFRDKNSHSSLNEYIKNNQICTNKLILSELLPFLKINKKTKLIKTIIEISEIKLTIDWDFIINLQIQNLKNGINKIGIPDLIILDNVIQNNLVLYTEDKHFQLMKKIIKFETI